MINMSKRRSLITWGLVTMFLIAPFLSWVVGAVYGTMVSSGFAAGGLMVILFPIIFIVGLVMMIKGFKEPKQL